MKDDIKLWRGNRAGMVASERKQMEASACNSRNGWRSSPLPVGYCGRVDAVDDTWVNKVPVIVPCYNGKSLQIHEELVVNGLSAISIKHYKGNCSDAASEAQREGDKEEHVNQAKGSKSRTSRVSVTGRESVKKHSTTELPVCLGGRMKRRNSFWNMHRPELSKLTWPQNFISSAMLQDFFHHHLRTHGTFCEPLHVDTDPNSVLDEEIRDYTVLRELVPPTALPPDEKAVNIMEKSRSVQLNDEDLDPEIMVHKSRAEFCVTIGEYVRKPPLKRSASHQLPKAGTQSAGRFETISVQRDGFLSKEEVNSEELVSSIVGSPAAAVPVESGENHREKSSSENPQLPSSGENNAAVEELAAEDVGDQAAEDVGDPSRLRAILSPRDEEAEICGLK